MSFMDDPYGDPNTNLIEHIVLITIVSHFKGVLGLWDLRDLSSDLLRVKWLYHIWSEGQEGSVPASDEPPLKNVRRIVAGFTSRSCRHVGMVDEFKHIWKDVTWRTIDYVAMIPKNFLRTCCFRRIVLCCVMFFTQRKVFGSLCIGLFCCYNFFMFQLSNELNST